MRRTLVTLAVVIAAVALGAGKVAGLSGSSDSAAPAGGAGGAAGARVTRVVDGDTIVVSVGGRTERVRYIGMDTPESVKPGTPVQCYAKAASKENEKLVEGQAVRLVGDREARDRYGRMLAYVYRKSDGLFINAELVRRGYAKPLTIRPNVAHEAEFARLARTAKRGGRGLWSRC